MTRTDFPASSRGTRRSPTWLPRTPGPKKSLARASVTLGPAGLVGGQRRLPHGDPDPSLHPGGGERELLTALIVDAYDAYDAVGVAAETADARCPRADLAAGWLATCRAIRGWAVDHPHEYALVYGSPVPGYHAPETTVGPASRAVGILAGILSDGVASAALPTVDDPALATAVKAYADVAYPPGPADVVSRALIAWTTVFGTVSFELFGHLRNVVADHAAYFDHVVAEMGAYVGLPGTSPVPAVDSAAAG